MEFERKNRRDSYIDIAPLVDVVFLLLLFFMLSFQTALEPAIRISLPQSKTADAQAAEDIVISLSREGGIYVGDQSTTLEQVGSIIRNRLQGKTEPSVKLKADREVPVELLVHVMDEVRSSGCSTLSIVTREK